MSSRNLNKNLKETREFTSHSRWGGTFQALGTAHAKVRKGSACLA